MSQQIILLNAWGVFLCEVPQENLLRDTPKATTGRCVDIWSRDHRVQRVSRNTWKLIADRDVEE
jgi:hypothetical protein